MSNAVMVKGKNGYRDLPADTECYLSVTDPHLEVSLTTIAEARGSIVTLSSKEAVRVLSLVEENRVLRQQRGYEYERAEKLHNDNQEKDGWLKDLSQALAKEPENAEANAGGASVVKAAMRGLQRLRKGIDAAAVELGGTADVLEGLGDGKLRDAIDRLRNAARTILQGG